MKYRLKVIPRMSASFRAVSLPNATKEKNASATSLTFRPAGQMRYILPEHLQPHPRAPLLVLKIRRTAGGETRAPRKHRPGTVATFPQHVALTVPPDHKSRARIHVNNDSSASQPVRCQPRMTRRKGRSLRDDAREKNVSRALAMLALEITTRDRRRWRGGRRFYIRRPRAGYTLLVTFSRLRSTTERDNIGPGSLRGSSCLPSRDGEPGVPGEGTSAPIQEARDASSIVSLRRKSDENEERRTKGRAPRHVSLPRVNRPANLPSKRRKNLRDRGNVSER